MRRAAPGAGRVRIGISGWRYAPWRGVFYPRGLAQRRELEFAASHFDSIELNGSFYSLQRASSYAEWRDAVPDDFVFAVKGSRYITHLRRLRDVELALANFFASGMLLLGRRLGPFLWQLPPNLRFDAERLDRFLDLLPRTLAAAALMAHGHDRRVRDPGIPEAPSRLRLRHALEVRNPTFCVPEFVALLRRHRVALVIADTAGTFPQPEDVTADFLYLRLHGDEELYASGYGDPALRAWARRIARWAAGEDPARARRIAARAPPRRGGRDVYCYFDNDAKVRAPFDARRLRELLRLPARPHGEPGEEQGFTTKTRRHEGRATKKSVS